MKKIFSIFTILMAIATAQDLYLMDPSSAESGKVLSSTYNVSIAKTDEEMKVVKNILKTNFLQNWSNSGAFILNGNTASVKNYTSNANDSMTSSNILLPLAEESQRIILSYNEKYELESDYDFGFLKLSTDGGSNWEIVHSVTGRNNAGKTEIDLSEYSGKTVSLQFQLRSNESNEYSGWEISSLYIDLKEVSNTSITSSYTASATGDLSTVYTSLNSQNFPYILSNINVTYQGSPISTLTSSDFSVLENDVLQTQFFEVIPPDTSSSSRLVDIIFIMDNSGSLSDEQAAVENNVDSFISALQAANVDFALGLTRYGQSADSGQAILEDNANLTQDATYFINTVWARNVVDGGTEPAYDAIIDSLAGFNFRPGSQKVIILITDEQPNQGTDSEADAKISLENSDAMLYVLTGSSLFYYYDDIYTSVLGARYFITDPFNDILQDISTQVSSSYIVKYKSSDPVLNGIERFVKVRVSHDNETVEVIKSYIPGALPKIERTAQTISYETQAWPENTEFSIEAEITDSVQPFVTTATLYYKLAVDSFYTSVTMLNTQGDIWAANIPLNFAKRPGVSYYISATDGVGTASLPSVDAQAKPFYIAILPNEAPYIGNVSTGIDNNGNLEITATMTDNTNVLSETSLFYRKLGDLSYQKVTMVKDANSDIHKGIIPSSSITAVGVEYYLFAKDDFGVVSTYGTSDKPEISAIFDISGTVIDAVSGLPLVNAEVSLVGVSTTYTDSQGNYSFINLEANNYTLNVIFTGYVSETKTLLLDGSTSSVVNFSLIQNTIESITIKVEWGEYPTDLDSHFLVPSETGCYHIAYWDKGSIYNFPFASLDLDDVSSYGPETITIEELQPGVSEYWIHNYSQTPTLDTSNAVVKVYNNAVLIKEYRVPTSNIGVTDSWHVFNIDSNGNIRDINKFDDYNNMSCSDTYFNMAPIISYLLN